MALDPYEVSKIQSIQDKAEAAVAAAQQQALAAIEDLRSFTQALPSFSSSVAFDFSPTRPSGIDQATLAGKPTFHAVARPSDVETTIEKHRGHVFLSPFLDTLTAQVSSIITSGGVGVDQATQEAIFEQGRGRLSRVMNDELDAANGLYAGQGFDIPTSMVYAARDAVIERYGDKRSDLNNKIIEIISERARQNVQDAMAKGLAVETLHADFTTNFNKLFIDSARYVVEAYEIETRAAVAQFDGEMKGFLANVDVAKINSDIDTTYAQLQMAALKAHTETQLKNVDLIVQQLLEKAKMKVTALDAVAKSVTSVLLGHTGQVTGITAITKK